MILWVVSGSVQLKLGQWLPSPFGRLWWLNFLQGYYSINLGFALSVLFHWLFHLGLPPCALGTRLSWLDLCKPARLNSAHSWCWLSGYILLRHRLALLSGCSSGSRLRLQCTWFALSSGKVCPPAKLPARFLRHSEKSLDLPARSCPATQWIYALQYQGLYLQFRGPPAVSELHDQSETALL